MTAEEERAIWKKVRRGNASAFETVAVEYERMLYTIALRMLASPEDAADAVQETFLKAWTARKSFRGESKLSTWLCRILNNACIDQLRRRRDTEPLTLSGADGEETEREIPDESFDPAALVEREELRSRVREAVGALPPEFRAPLLLREFGGLRYDEIAETLSLEVNTVRTRIFRARKRLCALLAEDGNFSDKGPSDQERGGERP
ncbi:MAG: sigma-70 family RNA polymerase sigma factor [Oscillospiraceae bacterium]|nr:sigma-70 family RNA polymerase sigma factor [Oscillospiraceae bacterium]